MWAREDGLLGLPWLSNSHSTREEFLKGPGGLRYAFPSFFLVDPFILEFLKQKFSAALFIYLLLSILFQFAKPKTSQKQIENMFG